MNERKLRRNKIIIETAAIILCLAVIALLIHYHVRTTFTEKKWLDNPDGRTHMVQDLIDKYTLIGMSEEEITAILGPESGTGSFRESDYPDETTLIYYIGSESSNRMWLILPLEGGVVQDVLTEIT